MFESYMEENCCWYQVPKMAFNQQPEKKVRHFFNWKVIFANLWMIINAESFPVKSQDEADTFLY